MTDLREVTKAVEHVDLGQLGDVVDLRSVDLADVRGEEVLGELYVMCQVLYLRLQRKVGHL